MLPLNQIFKVRTNRIESFRQGLSVLHGIDGEINCRDTRVAETIDYFGLHQAPVGRQVNKDVLLGAVVNDLVNELWTQQRLATH